MAKDNMEEMKRIIEEKKVKSSQQGFYGTASSKVNANPSKGFNKKKRAGSLNK